MADIHQTDLFYRYCYAYEGDDMETVIPPKLKSGEKIHYPIFHDECCMHANDQCGSVWMCNGEQPLRDKGQGRVIHISDFIIKHSGWLVLSESLQEEQLKLPKPPTALTPATLADAPDMTSLTVAAPVPAPSSTGGSTLAAKGKGQGTWRKAPTQPKLKPADC